MLDTLSEQVLKINPTGNLQVEAPGIEDYRQRLGWRADCEDGELLQHTCFNVEKPLPVMFPNHLVQQSTNIYNDLRLLLTEGQFG